MHKILALLAVLCFSTLCYSQENSQKTLIVFSAGWCGACKVAHHDMKNDPRLSEKIKEYEIIDVDFDKDKDLVKGYNIKSIPTFIIYQDGKEVDRKVGYKNSRDLIRFLK